MSKKKKVREEADVAQLKGFTPHIGRLIGHRARCEHIGIIL